MRVLVVWEPILATDWGPPGGVALGRLPDLRVRQFWDPHHVVAGALKDIAAQNPPQPEPDCCFDNGVYWDGAVLFPSGAHWKNSPASAFWNGPVYRFPHALEKTILEVAGRK